MHNQNEEANDNASCSHGKSTDRESMEKLKKENEALRKNNSELAHALADARRRIGDYRKNEIKLNREILEIKVRTFNQMHSWIAIIHENVTEILTEFSIASDKLSTVLCMCNLFNEQMDIMYKSDRSVKQQQQVQVTHTHTVKPQIVNEHVLQNPTTITLRKIEVPQQSTHRLSREEAQVETETNSYSSLDHESVVEPIEQTENISFDNMNLNISSSSSNLSSYQYQRLSTLVEDDDYVIENESAMNNGEIIEEKSNPLEFITIKRGQHFQSVSPENSFLNLSPTGSSTPFRVSPDRFSISLRRDVVVTKRRLVFDGIQNNSSDSESESCKAVLDSSKNKPKKSPGSNSDDDKSKRTSRILNKSPESKKDGKRKSLSNSSINKRPKRAARPKCLKELDLKTKMRR